MLDRPRPSLSVLHQPRPPLPEIVSRAAPKRSGLFALRALLQKDGNRIDWASLWACRFREEAHERDIQPNACGYHCRRHYPRRRCCDFVHAAFARDLPGGAREPSPAGNVQGGQGGGGCKGAACNEKGPTPVGDKNVPKPKLPRPYLLVI